MNMGIGIKIREQRLKRGITQQQLARCLGVTPSAVGNYECDVSFPKMEVLMRLFDTLGCTPNYLFGTESGLSPREEEHLGKFRLLDEHGKSLVETCTELELRRINTAPPESDEEEIPIAARLGAGRQLKLKKRVGKDISELQDYKGGRR